MQAVNFSQRILHTVLFFHHQKTNKTNRPNKTQPTFLKLAIPCINTAGANILQSGMCTPNTSLFASSNAVIVPHIS